MSSQNNGVDNGQSVAMFVVFGVVALVVATVLGASVYYRGKKPVTPVTAVAAVSATSLPAIGANADNAARNAMDAASVKVENGVVKFYFASGRSDLATGANAALADVVKGAQADRKLVISGYHDATGSATQNAELAKLRAFAVRDALKAAGVTDNKIEVRKTEELKVVGSNAEARRVEVALQ